MSRTPSPRPDAGNGIAPLQFPPRRALIGLRRLEEADGPQAQGAPSAASSSGARTLLGARRQRRDDPLPRRAGLARAQSARSGSVGALQIEPRGGNMRDEDARRDQHRRHFLEARAERRAVRRPCAQPNPRAPRPPRSDPCARADSPDPSAWASSATEAKPEARSSRRRASLGASASSQLGQKIAEEIGDRRADDRVGEPGQHRRMERRARSGAARSAPSSTRRSRRAGNSAGRNYGSAPANPPATRPARQTGSIADRARRDHAADQGADQPIVAALAREAIARAQDHRDGSAAPNCRVPRSRARPRQRRPPSSRAKAASHSETRARPG